MRVRLSDLSTLTQSEKDAVMTKVIHAAKQPPNPDALARQTDAERFVEMVIGELFGQVVEREVVERTARRIVYAIWND